APATEISGAPRVGVNRRAPAPAPERATSCLSARANPASGDDARPRVVRRSAVNRPIVIAGSEGRGGGKRDGLLAPSRRPQQTRLRKEAADELNRERETRSVQTAWQRDGRHAGEAPRRAEVRVSR